MKKYFLLAAAAATVLAVSCNKEKEQPKVDPTPGTEIEDNTPQPIRFGTNIAEVKAPITKGLGAVDNWSDIRGAETPGKLYIYGLERTTQAGTTYVWNLDGQNAIHPFINNVAAEAPVAGAGLDRRDAIEVLDVNNVIVPGENPTYGPYYYVDNKYYDFFGYYVDDAVTGIPAPVYTAATTEPAAPAKLDLAIVIDGSQDIMLASTDKQDDINWRTDQSKHVDVSMLYSAVSARRTVVPNLNFQHQLSRFVFNVVAADATVLEENRRTAIEGLLLYSDYKGTLTIVGTQGLAPVQEQQKNAQDAPLYYEVDPEDNTKHVWTTTTENTDFPVYFKGLAGTVNDSGANRFVLAVKPDQNAPIPASAQYSDIMVYPGAHSYHFDLLMSQVGTPYTAENPYVLPLDVTLPNNDLAEAGKKYVVNVVVYGLEAVQMTVSLAEWDEVDLGWVDPDATNEAARTEVELTLAQNPAGDIAVGASGYAIQITDATVATISIGDNLNALKTTAYFKSSDNTKVRIDKATGAITAVAAGSATITVTVSNETYYGSATIDVTVVGPVAITCADQNITIGGADVNLAGIATFSTGYDASGVTYALKVTDPAYDKATVSAEGVVHLLDGAAANDTFTVTITAPAAGPFTIATKDVTFTVVNPEP